LRLAKRRRSMFWAHLVRRSERRQAT